MLYPPCLRDSARLEFFVVSSAIHPLTTSLFAGRQKLIFFFNMPETQALPAQSGWIYYRANTRSSLSQSERSPYQTRSRRTRPSRIVVTSVSGDWPPAEAPKHRTDLLGKLAGSRDTNAFRLLRSAIAAHSASPKNDDSVKTLRDSQRRSRQDPRRASDSEMPGTDFLRHSSYAHGRGAPSNLKTPRGSLAPESQSDFNGSSVNLARARSGCVAALSEEKPVASGNGLSVNLNLAEPVLFLQGFDHAENSSTRNTAMLRGNLHIKVQKSVKLKAVSLRFRGVALTKWPEGEADRSPRM